MKTTTMSELRDALHAAYAALDPHHQGAGWPDPIAFDGRPLAEQAADLLAADLDGAAPCADPDEVGTALAALAAASSPRAAAAR